MKTKFLPLFFVVLLGITACQTTQTSIPLPTDQPDPFHSALVFYREANRNAEIYRMEPDGSGLQQLTDHPANDTSPCWSPDGTQIAFESDRDDPNPVSCFPYCNINLYVMNADGSNVRRLTSLEGSEWHADWSPDGESILFSAGSKDYQDSGIYVIDADGGEPRALLNDGSENDGGDWSVDGTRIAFTSNRDGNQDLYLMNADGSEITKFFDSGMNDYMPDWSPDGRRIAFFAANFPSVRQDIYVIQTDGSGAVNLSNTPAIVDENPIWSADGETIFFQTDRDGNFEIYSMEADGTNQQNLTNNSDDDYCVNN